MKKSCVNGFEVCFGGVVNVVDLDAIAIGPEKDCRKIRLEDRDFLVVSGKFALDTPHTFPPHRREYVIAPLPLQRHRSGGVICFRASECEDAEDLVLDMGLTFEGDECFENGHYFLWNPETGELSISEEMDWLEVMKFDLRRWEENLVPDGAVQNPVSADVMN